MLTSSSRLASAVVLLLSLSAAADAQYEDPIGPHAQNRDGLYNPPHVESYHQPHLGKAKYIIRENHIIGGDGKEFSFALVLVTMFGLGFLGLSFFLFNQVESVENDIDNLMQTIITTMDNMETTITNTIDNMETNTLNQIDDVETTVVNNLDQMNDQMNEANQDISVIQNNVQDLMSDIDVSNENSNEQNG